MIDVISETQMKAPDGYIWKQIDEETIKLVKKDQSRLHLEVSDHLYICYKDKKVGVLYNDKRAYILSMDEQVIAYEEWRKNGMLVDHTSVEWGGRRYYIDQLYRLRSKSLSGGDCCNIYALESCVPIINRDPNIMRHKHNNITRIY